VIAAIREAWHDFRLVRARKAVSQTYAHIEREVCMHTEQMAHLRAELAEAQRQFRELTGIDPMPGSPVYQRKDT
jgi:hypothetical protein